MSSLKEDILHYLQMTGNLTIRQLMRLVYQEAWTSPEEEQGAYENVSKALQRLKASHLVQDKHYGLGKEKLWRIPKTDLTKKLSLPGSDEVHSLLYEHDKLAKDILIGFILTGELETFVEHVRISPKTIPDLGVKIRGGKLYIEEETGQHDRATVIQKIRNYQAYWRGTGEDFFMILTAQNDAHHEELTGCLLETKAKFHYLVGRQEQLAKDPLNARLMDEKSSSTLSSLLSR